MRGFSSNQIIENNEIIAQELKTARQEKKIKLSLAAKELKINRHYLEALEKGQTDKLPAGMYGKNFLKEYALYLKINPEKLLELFDKESGGQNATNSKNPFLRNLPKSHYFLTIPKIIKNTIIIILIIICLAYIAYYLRVSLAPPMISLYSPEDNITISSNTITISGIAEPEAEVVINEENILIDEDGNFSKNLNLRSGLNTITIVTKKKFSRKNIIIRSIFVNSEK